MKLTCSVGDLYIFLYQVFGKLLLIEKKSFSYVLQKLLSFWNVICTIKLKKTNWNVIYIILFKKLTVLVTSSRIEFCLLLKKVAKW